MSESLDDYLRIDYPLRLIPDPDGGYVFEYPDLPGCLGQVESLSELAEHAEEVRRLWLETALELGKPIPPPASDEEYSGRFVVRIPKALHRRLAEAARAQGVSLNAFVGTLLAAGLVEHELRGRLDALRDRIDALRDQATVG